MFPRGGSSSAEGPYNRSTLYAACGNYSFSSNGPGYYGYLNSSTGTMVVGQWKPVVTVSGAGIFYSAVVTDQTSPRTLSIRVVLDGTIIGTQSVNGGVGNSTSVVINAYASHIGTASYFVPGLPMPFLNSLVIEVKNDTDTTSVGTGYAYTVSK